MKRFIASILGPNRVPNQEVTDFLIGDVEIYEKLAEEVIEAKIKEVELRAAKRQKVESKADNSEEIVPQNLFSDFEENSPQISTQIDTEEKSEISSLTSQSTYVHVYKHTHFVRKSKGTILKQKIDRAEKIIKLQKNILAEIDARNPSDEEEAEENRRERVAVYEKLKQINKELVSLANRVIFNR